MNKKSKQVFSDKLRLVYLQLPLFEKEVAECENDFDRWIYALKNMNDKAIAVGGTELSVSEVGGDSGCQLADEGGASPLRRSPPQVS